MSRTFKSVLAAGLLAISALLTAVPAASAAPEKPASPSDVAIQGIGQATQLKSHLSEAWTRFRPATDGEHLVIYRGHDIATICYVFTGGKFWDLVYDHTNKVTGYTLEEYLTVTSTRPCSSAGQAVDLLNTDQAWVHLYPRADWAHETVYQSHDVAAICYLNFEGRKWDLVLDHNNQVAGWTWDSAIREVVSTPCD